MFEVLDNFIPRSYQRTLLEVIGGTQTLWQYIPDMDYVSESGADEAHRVYSQYVKGIIDDDYSQAQSADANLHYLQLPLVGFISDHLGDGWHCWRSRLVAQHPIPDPPEHYNPHIDAITGKSAIYYLNDSDGDTFLMQEKTSSSGNPEDYAAYHIVDRVSPKQGRLIVFDSSQYHCGSAPTKGRRLLANLNFHNPDSGILCC